MLWECGLVMHRETWHGVQYFEYTVCGCLCVCVRSCSVSIVKAQTICYIGKCLCLIENLVKSKLQSPNYSVVFLVVIIHFSLCGPSKSYRARCCCAASVYGALYVCALYVVQLIHISQMYWVHIRPWLFCKSIDNC